MGGGTPPTARRRRALPKPTASFRIRTAVNAKTRRRKDAEKTDCNWTVNSELIAVRPSAGDRPVERRAIRSGLAAGDDLLRVKSRWSRHKANFSGGAQSASPRNNAFFGRKVAIH